MKPKNIEMARLTAKAEALATARFHAARDQYM